MHVMLDIETLATDQRAVVLSIGACAFYPSKSGIADEFHIVVDREAQIRAGRSMSVATVTWWMKQPIEARRLFDAPTIPVETALAAFANWLSQYTPLDGLWGNGSDFDNAIVGSLYDDFKLARPWAYWQNRCFRTIKSTIGRDVAFPLREGTHHDALDDAVHQAMRLQAIVQQTGVSIASP